MFIASPLSGDEDRRLTALSAIEQYSTINRPLQLFFFRKNVDNSANPDYNISDKGNRSAVSLVWLQKSNRSKLVRLGGYFFAFSNAIMTIPKYNIKAIVSYVVTASPPFRWIG